MDRFAFVAGVLLALAICFDVTAQPPPERADILAADTPRTTAFGTRFVAPKGWAIRTDGNAIVLAAPEGNAHVAIIDVRNSDADAALAAAWALYRPGSAPSPEDARDRPARDGWDQVRLYEYAAPAKEQRTTYARALRKDDRWTVAIVDLPDAVAEKRDTQLEVIFGKLLPPGFERETFAGKKAHRLDAARIAALSGFIEAARKDSDIPGVALGLVQDGRVVFEGGFGVRESGKPATVDADTLFIIASNTKPLTTLMLAKLVDAGRFDWDTPVTSLWPAFRLGDSDTTKQVRVKHLICACTGLPRQDMEWLFQGDVATPASMMQVLSTVQPTSAFGELYQYSNLLAAAGGYLGGHVLHPDLELGAAYDDAMQTLVFDPLGMRATTFDYARAQAGNHAAPHGFTVDGKIVRADMDLNYTGLPMRPDGAAWSNVHDLLRYVQMELAAGLLPNGRRYISEEALLARRVPQVAEGSDETYGMGLKTDGIWGIPVLHHGGTMIGYRADMIWLPDHGVGAVILINSDSGSSLRAGFRRRLLEVLFDGKPEAADQMAAWAKQSKAGLAAARKTLVVPAEAAESRRLSAHYRNAALGDIDVRRDGTTTVFDFGGWDSEMATRRDDDGTLAFISISPGEEGFEFVVDDAADTRRLVLRDAQHEYVFAPVP